MAFSPRRMFAIVALAWFVAGVSSAVACFARDWSSVASLALWPIGQPVIYAVLVLQVRGTLPMLHVASMPLCLQRTVLALVIGAAFNGLFWATILTAEFLVVRRVHRLITRRHPTPPPPASAPDPSR